MHTFLYKNYKLIKILLIALSFVCGYFSNNDIEFLASFLLPACVFYVLSLYIIHKTVMDKKYE